MKKIPIISGYNIKNIPWGSKCVQTHNSSNNNDNFFYKNKKSLFNEHEIYKSAKLKGKNYYYCYYYYYNYNEEFI